MTTAMRQQGVRWIGRIAAVGAVALLLAGSAAPAEANRRSEAVLREKGFCYEHGGDAYHFEFMDVWGWGCQYPGEAAPEVGTYPYYVE